MWFWWFMLVCNLLVPIIMILCGRMMWKHAPEKPNWVMGYRTSRSMNNIDTWKFAHDYCGRLWWKIGWIMLIVSVIIHFPIYGKSDDVIGWTGEIVHNSFLPDKVIQSNLRRVHYNISYF